MRVNHSALLLLAGFITLQAAQAQPTPEETAIPRRSEPQDTWRVRYFTPEDGLPGLPIYSLETDPNGYLWMGSIFGLVRYDGYTFKRYLPVAGDSTSINVVYITRLHIDERGKVWAGGNSQVNPEGVSVFDPYSETFSNYQHDPNDENSLIENVTVAFETPTSEPGTIWISSISDITARYGISRLDVESGRFTNYRMDTTDIAGTIKYGAFGLLEDQSSTLWSSGWGLNRIDTRPGQDDVHITTFLPEPDIKVDNRGLIPDVIPNVIYSIHEAQTEPGIFWLIRERGVLRFDVTEKTFETYFPSPDPGDDSNAISVLFGDRNGTLWVGTYGGLYTFDRATRRFSRFSHQLPSTSVYDIAEDRFGTLWVSGSKGELMKLEHGVNPFTEHRWSPETRTAHVLGIYVDRDGMLWSGSVSHIQRIDLQTGEVTVVASRSDQSRLAFGAQARFYEDQKGDFWVMGATLGLQRIVKDTGEIVRYTANLEDSTSLSVGSIQAILEDRKGTYWVGSWGGGINKLNEETGQFTHYSHDPGDPSSLIEDSVLGLYEDRDGRLWVGTERGISRFEPETQTFTNFSDDRMARVMMMREDHADRFWVATFTGLHRLDRDSGRIVDSFTTEDGLTSNSLYSVYDDAAGMLWVSADNGLSRIDPETRTVLNFTTRNGLPFNRFLEGAHYQTPEGELFYGGAEGIVSFSPDQIVPNLIPPEVLLTDLRIGGESVRVSPDGPLHASISVTEAITLPFNQNDVTFDYVGLQSIDPELNQYRYTMEGLDDGWVDAGKQRTARYPQLPPGDYVFRVNAANSQGVWNETGASVRITILPPWWRTVPMFLVYGSLFLVGVYGVDRVQRRRLLRRAWEEARERELEHAQEIKEAHANLQQAHMDLEQAHENLKSTQQQLIQQEKMASLGHLTAGIAHEIKNPLNFVNNFAQLNKELANELLQSFEDKRAIDPEELQEVLNSLKQNAAQIEKHGVRADAIVKSMMQHASAGEGERYEVAINPLVDEFVGLTYGSFRSQHPDVDIEIEKNLDAAVGSLTIAPQEIGRVLQNILGNGFEAVYEMKRSTDDGYEPKVHISTHRSNGQVEIRISDNGPGIPASVRDRVFEPFFTTKPAGSGTGLGLSLSYDIVTKGHGGNIEVEGEGGEGATFVIRLPVDKG